MTPEQWRILVIVYALCLFFFAGINAWVFFCIKKICKNINTFKSRALVLKVSITILMIWLGASLGRIFVFPRPGMTTEEWTWFVGKTAGWGIFWAGGILGYFVGSYRTILETNGSKERAFVVKCVIVATIAIFSILALKFVFPFYGIFALLLFFLLAKFGLSYWTKKQMQIRQQETQDKERANEPC